MAAPEKHVHIPGIAGGDLPENERDAYEEGHDADIPSKAGIVQHDHSSLNQTTSADPEKGGKHDVSSDTSEHGERDIEKAGPTETTAEDPKDEPVDPNVVDWEGPNDPANPLNWTTNKKWSNIGILSFLTLLTPLASSMFAPGVPDVIQEFHTNKCARHDASSTAFDAKLTILQCVPCDFCRLSLYVPSLMLSESFTALIRLINAQTSSASRWVRW